MKVEKVENLQVWQRALKFAEAVSAIAGIPAIQRDPRLREQLNECTDSIVSNIAGGFGQSSDRAFARYLSISKGSALEAKAHLVVAVVRKYITAETYEPLERDATEIVKMLAGLIGHLRRSDWKHRT